MENHHLVEDFINKIRNKKCLTYEICPDKSPSIMPIISKIKLAKLHEDIIDGFVCTDSPLAKLKMHSGMASIKIQQELQKPVICTISMRDRNSLALSAELLGLNEFDIRIFLALSGDPLKLGDQPQAKAVFEGNSHRILELIEKLNSGLDLVNNALKSYPKQIYGFSVLNSYSKKVNILKNKMESKICSNALALFTQPIYDIEVSKILHEWLEELNARHNKQCVIMQGFFPITSFRRALFLYEKLPGVFIPELWLETMQKASLRGVDYEKQKGLEMSSELFSRLYEYSPKIHFMNHNAPNSAKRILEHVR
ncbi:methylenetetrahydrofolate reductase [Helicobacter muridarum]|uniref:Methylenetetrahydrofolate reductase n=1 Tax=Helicobacter muridarum TaxID=216 RepID=A0A099TXC1_9HELI|nr:methylenetetrahydrofolate reductase [Helicobacter muridarum]TLE00194.1 methylenetetrahydrofolate reductase [Helicobacter muridarum]STQ85677.1 methylenetetrahydrofolate reductase [Helicobacter muridarum]